MPALRRAPGARSLSAVFDGPACWLVQTVTTGMASLARLIGASALTVLLAALIAGATGVYERVTAGVPKGWVVAGWVLLGPIVWLMLEALPSPVLSALDRMPVCIARRLWCELQSVLLMVTFLVAMIASGSYVRQRLGLPDPWQ